MHSTSFPENRLELKADLKGLSALWSQIMWLGLYFLSHKQYVEVRCYSKETLEITPELTWCANISVSLSNCSCHHRLRDTSSEEEIRNSTREQKTKERRRGLLIFNQEII